jgi:hypothetical protein
LNPKFRNQGFKNAPGFSSEEVEIEEKIKGMLKTVVYQSV